MLSMCREGNDVTRTKITGRNDTVMRLNTCARVSSAAWASTEKCLMVATKEQNMQKHHHRLKPFSAITRVPPPPCLRGTRNRSTPRFTRTLTLALWVRCPPFPGKDAAPDTNGATPRRSTAATGPESKPTGSLVNAIGGSSPRGISSPYTSKLSDCTRRKRLVTGNGTLSSLLEAKNELLTTPFVPGVNQNVSLERVPWPKKKNGLF